MSNLHVRSRFRHPFRYSFLSFFVLSSMLIVGLFGGTALAKRAVPKLDGDQHFTKQARIGFQAGDDWETALTHDRFGHLYAMYKHYDVPGGQT